MFENVSKLEMPLISVIVPVYGVEKYVNRCIDSILSQTYKNLEILLIDDGTKDNSGIICDQYTTIDSRVKVYHKENGGLSDARNYGIEKSTGEYLVFIDADDYVDKDYVEFLYTLLDDGKYKMAICSLHVLFTSNGKILNKGNGKKAIISGEQCIEMMCYHDEVDTAAYAKIFHKSLLESVRFPVGKIFEDIGTIYLLFDQCEEIACHFKPKYWYIIREGSIVTSSFNEKKLDLIEMTDKMAEYVNQKYPHLKKATLRRQGYARLSTINQMIDINEKKYLQIRSNLISYLRRNGLLICMDSKTPKRDKIAYICIMLGFPVYKFSWKLYIKKQRG